LIQQQPQGAAAGMPVVLANGQGGIDRAVLLVALTACCLQLLSQQQRQQQGVAAGVSGNGCKQPGRPFRDGLRQLMVLGLAAAAWVESWARFWLGLYRDDGWLNGDGVGGLRS
jgi:hypothetical protein